MFDILGESKPKSQPAPQISKPKIEPPKSQPQPKVETTPQPQNQQNNNEQIHKIETTQSKTSITTTPINTNNIPSVNKTSSITLAGNESDYGVIIADTKKCKPCEGTNIGKSKNVSIALSKPEKKKEDYLKRHT
jgi:hypothetical protein